MKLLILFSLVVACGCTDPQQFKCIDGVLYDRFAPDRPWRAVDGAPSHAGYTPVPCKATDKPGDGGNG